MSDSREVFTVLENTAGAGVAWKKKLETDTHATIDLAPVVAGKKGANFSLLPVSSEATAVTDAQPGLVAKDLAGLMQFIAQRLEGAAVSGVGALPSLVFKDLSGNFAYGKVNADGEIVTSNTPAGTPIFDDAIVVGVLNTETPVVTLTLNADEAYETIQAIASSTRTTKWTLKTIQDAAGTPVVDQIASWITGSGQFTFDFSPKLWNYTAGSTGVQELVLYGTQLQGDPSDMHGFVEVFEKA